MPSGPLGGTIGRWPRSSTPLQPRHAPERRSASSTSLVELEDASRLISRIWDDDDPKAPTSLLRALTHAGNFVAGAFDNGRLVGVSFGFVGLHDGELHLHSHITGVDGAFRGRSLGYALKLFQRAWALERGLDTVLWTADPLVRSNAVFNLAKLGATMVAYHENFYGVLDDGMNAGESDRVVLQWDLTSVRAERAAVGRSRGSRRRRGHGGPAGRRPNGSPESAEPEGDVLRAWLPPDIVRLRDEAPSDAADWRSAVRDHSGTCACRRLPGGVDLSRRLAGAPPMRLESVELRRIRLPLRAPFRTSLGTVLDRDILLVHVFGDGVEGWGECVAFSIPFYSYEYTDGAQDVMRSHLLPRLLAEPDVTADDVARLLAGVRGHPMAKGAIEMAVLDAELRLSGTSFGEHLGAVRKAVDCGVSVGIHERTDDLLRTVEGFLQDGYRRIKLKIEHGHDLEPVRAVRERFGDILFQVDANAAYTLADARHLAELDEFELLLIEQPLPEEDVRGHARLAETVRTPICLDESITSALGAEDAIALGACRIVNIKAGRVGGYLEARRVHDVCAANGVPVWCGGMLETALGRAANVALAALPNFTLPGDTSASDRFYAEDICEPFVLRDGQLDVPTGPGLGVTPIPEILDRVTTQVELLRPT